MGSTLLMRLDEGWVFERGHSWVDMGVYWSYDIKELDRNYNIKDLDWSYNIKTRDSFSDPHLRQDVLLSEGTVVILGSSKVL